ncbi:MAG: hypothetical protein QM813_26795 [Verrucomicrobiota bacterium]
MSLSQFLRAQIFFFLSVAGKAKNHHGQDKKIRKETGSSITKKWHELLNRSAKNTEL